MSKLEHVILVDKEDHILGTAEKLLAHRQGLLHRAFSVFILRHHAGIIECLLQQRQRTKYHSATLWTNTCCSHPRPNETLVRAAIRRLKEEMGFECPLSEVGVFLYKATLDNGLIEHEFDHVFVGILEDENLIMPNPLEVMKTRWVPLQSLKQTIEKHPEQYTAWLAPALQCLVDNYRSCGW